MSVVKITIRGDNFYDGEWPRVPRGLCFWCCHSFRGVPVLVPTWRGNHYHLRGNYCSWNCAKSDTISKCRAGAFPQDATSLTLFAYKISFRGRNCKHNSRVQAKRCDCYSRFAGVLQADDKETLEAFGGSTTIAEFRRDFLTIDSYEWVTRSYSPGERSPLVPMDRSYLFTLKPLRRVKVIDSEEDEDPIVLIKRRVF